MNVGRTLHQLRSRLLRPRPTVRWRLTLLYSGLFLTCGAALLAITDVLFARFELHPGLPPGFHPRATPPTTAAEVVRVRAAVAHAVAHQRSADLHRLLVVSWVALAITALVSAALGWLVAGRMLSPLRTIAATTRQISEANLHQRLAMPGPRDELRQLADTIDGLLDRLERAFEAQRRFVSNASHELRTPVAMMRTFLDVAIAKPEGAPPQLRALDANLRGALDQTDRLLDSFLTLARAENGAVATCPVQLKPIVTTALATRADAIAEKQIRVSTAVATVSVRGAEMLLSRMVDNVIENAVRHNQCDGEINVELDARDHHARLAVEQRPVLDPEAVGQLAQPFTRLGQERTGSQNDHGLGLSIVAAVAAAHGGTLELSPRPAGGLRVQISLPLATGISR